MESILVDDNGKVHKALNTFALYGIECIKYRTLEGFIFKGIECIIFCTHSGVFLKEQLIPIRLIMSLLIKPCLFQEPLITVV